MSNYSAEHPKIPGTTIDALSSGKFRARYRESGVYVAAPRTFDTWEQAHKYLKERKRSSGVQAFNLSASSTFDEWKELFVSMPLKKQKVRDGRKTSKKKSNTGERYLSTLNKHVSPYIGDLPIVDIDYEMALEFKGDLEERLEEDHPDSLSKAWTWTTWVLNLAQSMNVITYNAFSDPRISKPDGSLRRDIIEVDEDQIDRLISKIDPRYRRAIFIAAYTGLRSGEMWGWKLDALKPKVHEINVHRALYLEKGEFVLGSVKGGKSRVVAVADEVWAAIEEQVQSNPSKHPDSFLFTSPEGGPIRHNNFARRIFRPALAAAKMPPGFRFHDLRHFCVHYHISLGLELHAIKDLCGHRSITVTSDTYGDMFDRVRQENARKVSDAMSARKGAISTSRMSSMSSE